MPEPLKWYDDNADNPPWIKALAEVRRLYLTTERGDRLTLEDDTTYLVAEQKRRQCQLALGEVGI
jgi:hypothetical protein